MTMLYHGTTTQRAIMVAVRGALLSNWDRQIEELRQSYIENPSRKFEDDYPGKTIEQVALEWQSKLYGEHEMETRVKSLSVAKTIGPTISYAKNILGEEKNLGGLVLGIELSDFQIADLSPIYGGGDIVYIPRILSIVTLKEIHLSPKATENKKEIIKAFKKYKPAYFLL